MNYNWSNCHTGRSDLPFINKDIVSWRCIWSVFQECWVYCNNEKYIATMSMKYISWKLFEVYSNNEKYIPTMKIYSSNEKYIATIIMKYIPAMKSIWSIFQQWKVYCNNGKYIATASRAMKQQEAKSFVWREHHMLLSGRVWWWRRYKNYHFDKHDDILGEELQMRFQAVLCLLGLRQIQFKIWRNIFHNLHKYVLQFDEIHLTIL